MTADEEKTFSAQQCLSGFASLAHFITSDDDHSTAVHRTFDKLATRDLLYYQAELLELENRQDQYDRDDAVEANKADCSSPEWLQIRQHARDWSSFKRGAKDSSAAAVHWKRRMDLAMQIRATLKEYREALTANAEVLSLSRPSKQTMTALSNTFHQKTPRSLSSDDFPEVDPILLGDGARLFPLLTPGSPMPATDHVSLKRIPEPDLLTYFLKEYCSWLFRTRPRLSSDRILHLSTPEVSHYSMERLNFTASFIATMLAALLLFVPIYVLYHVSSTQAGLTLGLIALFTCSFAGAVALVTSARRAEIFGSCAAYSAVLVVFVSGGFANGTGVGHGG